MLTIKKEEKDVQFSIIVASYNYEKYIRQTLDSILNQTYKNYEVIIVDDGSGDNSIEIIKEYTNKYDNFYLYTHKNNKNKGLSETVRLGISKAKGEYICFCESDDYWTENHLEEKFEYIKNNPLQNDMITNDIELIGPGAYTKEEYVNLCANNLRATKDSVSNFCFLDQYNHAVPTFSIVTIKRRIIQKLNFETPIKPWLDWWLWRQVACDYKIGFIDKKLTCWRIHNSYNTKNVELHTKMVPDFIKKSDKFILKNQINNRKKLNIKKVKSNVFVHLHLYYHEQVDYFISKLKNISGCNWTLYVTYVDFNEESINKIKDFKKDAIFKEVDNLGYDIYPFIKVIKSVDLSKYDYVLKLHTKNYYSVLQVYNGKKYIGYDWRDSLVETHIGSKKVFLENLKILSKEDCGIVVNKDLLLRFNTYAESPLAEENHLLVDLKQKLNLTTNYDYFVAGTMFFAKACIFEKLINYDFNDTDFDNISITGGNSSCAHTLERIFCMLAIEKGFTVEKYSEYFFDNGGQLCSMENSPTISFWINKGKDTNKDYIEYQIDKFYKRQDKKVPRILVVSHEFTLTGAPKVALILSRTLKNIYGVSPVVISLKSGPIKSEFIDENLFVLEMNDFNVNKENFEKYFNKFDCVIFSSWVYPVLGCYNKTIVPPFAWYCHEAFEQEHFIPVYNQIREFVASNDIVLAGSPVTKTGMKMLCPEKQIDLLLYGTNDLSKNKANRKNKPEAIKSKRIFLFPATMEQRKNQCFLAEAIKNLPKDIQDKSHFIFIGRSIIFKEYYQQFKDIVEGLSCVEHIEEVPFDELMEYYDKADCIVVPSTFDPMPMVATYGFMKKKLCLLSDLIGSATLVKNNENAVLFNTKNALELTEKLKDITLNYEDYKQIAEKGREVYENNFSIEIFERKIKKYVDVLLLKNRKRRIKLFLNNIFSVKNIAPHKVFTILGIKLKFKTKKLIRLQNLQVNSFSENIFSVRNNEIHKVVTVLGVKIKLKSKKLLKLFNSEQNSFFEDIFSVRNIGFYKVITILGLKLKFKSEKLKQKQLKQQEQNIQLEPQKTVEIPAYENLVVYFDHSLGGGTETYFNNQVSELDDSVALLRVQYFLANQTYKITVYNKQDVVEYANIDFLTLSETINNLKINKMVLNNIVAYPFVKDILDLFNNYKKRFSNVEVIMKGHDFYCICPEWNLLNYNNEYCGINCLDNECIKCFDKFRLKCEDIKENFSITFWRKIWGDFLINTVDFIEVFSPSSKKIFSQAYPETVDKIVLKPHKIKPFPKYNIGVLGYSCVFKGSIVIKNLVDYLEKKRIYDYRFVIIGNNCDNITSELISSIGIYNRNDLPVILKNYGIDMIFIASIWPETFSYTTAESISLNYPVACFNMGGQADQVKNYSKGLILSSFESEIIEKEFRAFLTNKEV